MNDDFESIYFDDTDQQIELLKQIASDPTINVSELRRIMHAMEGAAGVMGHEPLRIAVFEICKRIERSLSSDQLFKACEVLGDCNDQLRQGQPLSQTSEEIIGKFQGTC